MIVRFTVEVEGKEFRFEPVNIKRLQLFQVYTDIDGTNKRFHMQINEATKRFHITDKDKLPADYIQFEQELNDAIFKHCS